MNDPRTAQLRQSLTAMSQLEETILKDIVDEKEAQEEYARLSGELTKLSRINPVFLQMSNDISRIYRDEVKHEGMLRIMLTNLREAKKLAQTELAKREATEQYQVEMGFPGAQITGSYGRKWK